MLPVTQHVLDYSGDCLTQQHYLKNTLSLHKRLLASFSFSCSPPAESGMWRGFWERHRRCSLTHPLCTVLSTTPQPRTWWWPGATTLCCECGDLMWTMWMASCCRSLRVTTVSSTQFVLTLKVLCFQCFVFVCVCVCVNLIINRQPARDVHLSPSACWDRPPSILHQIRMTLSKCYCVYEDF